MNSPATATILIVDDEGTNRKLLEVLLAREGYLTQSATNGEQALAAVAQRPPDLILLDIMMPGMDGYQVTATLKANPATADIPIILVTAHFERSSRLLGLNAGAEDFLTKPIDRVELCLRVRNLLRLKEALQQSKNSLQQLLAHQEKTKEEERKRIAREIHDDLGQNLMALRIDISILHERTARTHPRLHSRVDMALRNIDATVKSVRSIINNLRPFELELGLQAAIEWQLTAFQRSSGIACQLSIDEGTFTDALDDAVTLVVFRILQEALTNIARHSRATRAVVALSWNQHRFSMTVSDNGVGTAADARKKVNSFGIMGMMERASAHGGELSIDSGSGGGTVLSVSIPVARGAAASSPGSST